MQSTSNPDKKALAKILWTLFRWIGLGMWIYIVWAFEGGFGIKILCTIIILVVESSLTYNNIKDKKSIWG